MFGGLFDDVLELVKRWRPKRGYEKETQYRDDLYNFLMRELNGESSYTPIFGSPEPIRLKKEANRSLADIAVGDRQVGIELKKDLKVKSKIDRLMGQIDHYVKDYKEGVIVVLVGSTEKSIEIEVKTRLKEKLEGINVGFSEFRYAVVTKRSRGGTTKRVRSKANKFNSPFSNMNFRFF